MEAARVMCAAWCDHFVWSARDEDIHFDGCAFYDWALDEVLTDLRAALAVCDVVLDELVGTFAEVVAPVLSAEGRAASANVHTTKEAA